MSVTDYSKYFSHESLSVKIKQFAKKAGSKVTYYVFLLYNVMNSRETPLKTRLSIAAALGYFILPADTLPDLVPLLGFTDDLAVLLFALRQVSAHVTPEIKSRSREQCNRLFKISDEKESPGWDADAGI